MPPYDARDDGDDGDGVGDDTDWDDSDDGDNEPCINHTNKDQG